MKISPSKNFHKQISATSRITNLFFDLLEHQFTTDHQKHFLQKHSPQNYAGRMTKVSYAEDLYT